MTKRYINPNDFGPQLIFLYRRIDGSLAPFIYGTTANGDEAFDIFLTQKEFDGEYLSKINRFYAARSSADIRAVNLKNRRAAEVESRAPKKSTKRNMAKKPGHVYLIRYGHHHKIGKTSDLIGRSKSIGLLLPERHEMVATAKVGDMGSVEAVLHKKYSAFRVNGEWFDFSSGQLAEVKKTFEGLS